MRGGVQIKIVGHEALGASRHLLLLDDGMPAFDNFEVAGSAFFCGDELWPAVISQGSVMRKRGKHVHFRQGKGGLADSFGLSGDGGAQLGKETPLDLGNFFLSIENFGFVLLEFGRGKALRAHESLLALVILGNKVQV